jgi:2-keto-3-deoxy-L-rhamnonate aldolase RhmA
MDLGIDGFCATLTSTVEEAKAVVAATKYHPLGERGISGMCAGFNYGFTGDMNVAEYMEFLNENTIIIITLESEEGIKNAEAIAKLDGIDCVSVGAGDLSLSMGYKADKNHPEVVKLVKEAERKIIEAGNITTVGASTPDEVIKAVEKGEKLLMIGTDLAVIRNTFRNLVQANKGN